MISFRVTTTGRPVRVQLYRRTPEGPFHACFFWRGERHRISTDHHVEREARAAAKLAVIRISEQPHKETTSARLPLSAAITRFLDEVWPDKTGETYANVKGRLYMFEHAAENATIDLVDASFDRLVETVQTFLNARSAAGMKPRTVINDKLVLSRFFTWLSKQQPRVVSWRGNPASSAHLTIPKPQQKASPPLPVAVQKLLIESTQGSEIWPIVCLCLGAGVRPIEAFRAHWDEIDTEQGVVPVLAKKKARLVPLCPSLCLYLDDVRQSGPVWPQHHDTAHDVLAVIRKKHGLPKTVTYQAMRRTAAVRIAREVDTVTYAVIMGHSLDVAQQHYLEAKALMLNDPYHPDSWQVRARAPQKAPQEATSIS